MLQKKQKTNKPIKSKNKTQKNKKTKKNVTLMYKTHHARNP